ncbi:MULTISPECIES: DUF1800 domain-containing protein [unclassified Roseovarius]|uniref:DUF1800 domain-containing protein n=1 Tax=unclassified Roseovarius TaxID=2614913 RepID=UPI00273DD999|nr:DUF1800 domain-containing protein [Roseovarius sp. MMSF_3350]
MPFDPARAAIRFGCGLSPAIPAPESVNAMLEALAGPDRAAERFPAAGFEAVREAHVAVTEARRRIRNGKSEAEREAALKDRQDATRELRRDAVGWFGQTLMRRVKTEDGFRERLVGFWADHFTAQGPGGALRFGYAGYVEDAIRPHVGGRFSDMLKAAVTHPLMLIYLNQTQSVGPGSAVVTRRGKKLGLNENLARELLELHTLGVGGPYDQSDVRDLAKLLTGLAYLRRKGFVYRAGHAEPGPLAFMGRRYGDKVPELGRVMAVLEDLAAHPATAAHLARKMAVHFTGDAPDAGLVDAMAQAFRASDGRLPAMYAAMLEHPAAWAEDGGNVKQPLDFMASSLRALDVSERHLSLKYRAVSRYFLNPLILMGQSWGAPPGPDGFPEDDAAWITPQRMAARLQWGMTVPFRLMRTLPDPRDFVEVALGPGAPEPVRFAARAAETRAEGVGLVLASPAFQRM